MMTFDAIASELVKALGYELLLCDSDEEAIEQAEALKKGSNRYPVHFSTSDTSGEKAFEEFVTETETTDMERFRALGVITGKAIPNKEKIKDLFQELTRVFGRPEASKEEVITVLKHYLPNFEHIETGKSLDSKM